jgi:HK97 family phage portal protein
VSLFWRGRAAGERRYNGFSASFPSPPIPPNSASGGSYADISFAQSETSLQTVAMWAAVDLITSLVSEMPVDVVRGTGKDKQTLTTPGYLQDPGGDGYGLEDWIAQLIMSWLLRGNANGRIVERAETGGYPTQIQLYHPDSVAGWYGPDGKPVWQVSGQPTQGEMWHRRVHPVSGRLMGLSPVENQAAALGLALTTTAHGLSWFRDGAHPSGILTSDRALTKPQADTAKSRFMAALRGVREPVVLDQGWEYKQVQINPEESQFLETSGMSQAQVARIFGPGMAEVLGYETGNSLTYSTVEGRSQHLLVYALNKWLRRADRVLTQMLPRGQNARLNRSALLEPTVLDRWRVYQLQLSTKARSINEVRDDEDWSPVPWGKEPVQATPPAPGDPKQDPNEDPGTNPNGAAGGSK